MCTCVVLVCAQACEWGRVRVCRHASAGVQVRACKCGRVSAGVRVRVRQTGNRFVTKTFLTVTPFNLSRARASAKLPFWTVVQKGDFCLKWVALETCNPSDLQV